MSELAMLPASAAMGTLVERAEAFVRAAKSPATLRAYRSDWAHFEAWCQCHQLSALPAEPATVALYLTDLASCRAAGTITRRLTSISKAHQATGLDTPATTRHLAVSETLKGIRRTIGTSQRCKAPLLTKDLRKIIEHLPAGLMGVRDRALLLVGFAGGFRRSELASLTLADATFTNDGLVVLLRHSKTDQEGKGRKLAIPWGTHPDTCPVRSLREWITVAGIEDGALFRGVSRHGVLSGEALNKDSIGLIIKRAAERAGYDSSLVGGHSLRAGLATQAAMNGASELTIMQQTGHRSLTILRRYIRDGDLWRRNAAANLGL
jgi:site-specific recombinase XerD